MKLFERLRQLRTEKGVSRQEVADNANIVLRTYQRYEKGEREPDATTIIALADYFDVSIDYLVGRTDKPEVNK